ncbi:MAG: protein kinase domain-containing protein [Cellvibrionaceae bacterium]
MVDIPGYRIVRMLGKGGMASVYLAIQESFGRKVALKVMNPALSADVKFGQRFLSEAKIVSQLIHPNIVTVYDVGISDGQHYLSMEYVPGLDLKTKRTSLTIEESLQIVKDVAKALDYASMKGYVHRDVKPENIMLHEEDGRAVLMDFGIACLADKSSGMTQTGTAIGTPHYMSPEQAKGRAVDSRSDLYSLGVVLYLLIVGRVPYDADSAVAVGIKHISEPIPRLPNNITILQEIIDKLLAKEPLSRFQTGAELVGDIEALQNNGGAEIKSIANRRSPSGVGSHVTEAPTLISASVKAVAKFNPDNTTMPAIASAPSQKTQKVRVTKSKSGSVSAITKGTLSSTSGTVPVAGSKQRKNEKTSTAKQKLLDGKTNSGSNRAISQSVKQVSSGEFFAVDPEETREYSEDKSPSKTFALLMLLILIGGGIYGAVYFKHYLPYELQAVVNNGTEKVEDIKNAIYARMDLPIKNNQNESFNVEQQPSQLNSEPLNREIDVTFVDEEVASIVEESVSENGHQNEADPESVADATGNIHYEQLLAGEPEGSDLAKARMLRNRLDSDLTVSLPLAELYRNTLDKFPEDQKAEWGLEELKGFHFRKIRELFQVRDLAEIEKYIESLTNTFLDIESDEKYQQALLKLDAAKKAEGFIVQGDEFLVLNQLTSPRGTNALASYQKALDVDNENPIALESIQKIVQQYAALVSKAIEDNDYKTAVSLSRRGLKINSEDERLIELHEIADSYYQTKEKIVQYYNEAEKQIATGNLLSPYGESAFHQYNNILDVDEDNLEAGRALKGLEQIVAIEIENKINRSEYVAAKELLDNAQTYFPSVEKFIALQVSLDKAIEADFIASQPVISQLVVSSSPIERMDQPMTATSTVDRTIYIGFTYKNFHSETTVVQAVLYDVARSFQIAQAPVVVSDVDGFKVFSIDRPVEGFTEGGYNIDLMINGEQVGTLAFRVENQSTSDAPSESNFQ